MADRKITDLTALTTPASADVLPIVDVSEAAAADKNKKVTVGELFKGIPDGTAAAPAIAFESDDGNGLFLSTTDTIGIATNGVSRATVSTTAVTSTLPVIVPDGSAAAPSVAFTGSGTDTGLYSPGADQVAISTGGSARLYIDSTGKVSVGTISPVGNFVVSNGGAQGLEIFHSSVNNAPSLQSYNRSTSAFTQLSFNSLNYKFRVSDSDAVEIDSSGRVGVGTSSPDSPLQVIGNTPAHFRRTSAGFCNVLLSASTAQWSTGVHSDGYYAITHEGVGERLRIDSSGRLGVGTTSPSFPLDVRPVGVATARVGSQDNQAGFQLSSGNASNPFFSFLSSTSTLEAQIYGVAGSAAMVFATGASATERARIDSSGRLLVGTSSSRSAIGLQGLLQVESTGASAVGTIIRNSNDNAPPYLVFGKSRGTSNGSNTVVANGDYLGSILFAGADGNDLDGLGAEIVAIIDGTPGSNDLPTRLVFATTADGSSSPTERMRIRNDGTIKSTGYGGASVWTHEIENGSLGENYVLRVVSLASRNDATSLLVQGIDSGVQRFAFRSNGGLANYSANDTNLCDEREKKNIEDLESTWDCLKHWELKKFHYNEEDDSASKKYGVIAQQVEEHCPEVISEWVKQKAEPAKLDDEGNELEPAKEEIVRMGVKEQQMYWMAIKALQEAQVRIETLEAKVAALESV